MAKKTSAKRSSTAKIKKGMVARTQGAGMFGETVQQVLDVRPVPKSRGGGRAGDEAVILTYRKRAGKRVNLGNISVLPAEEAFEIFKKS